MLHLMMLTAVSMIALPTHPAQADAQGVAPAPLSAQTREHVRHERFQLVTAIRGLPLGVRDELQALFGQPVLTIADPGAPFQATVDVADPSTPGRRLAVAGCSPDHCLVYYQRGGAAPAWYAALFHWTPAKTRLEAGGLAPARLTTVDAVRTALLSGKVTSATRGW